MERYSSHSNVQPVWEASGERDDCGTARIPHPEGSGNVVSVNYWEDAADKVGGLPSIGDAKNVKVEDVTLADLDRWHNRKISWSETVTARREQGGPRELEFEEQVYLPVEVAKDAYKQLERCLDLVGLSAPIAEIEIGEAPEPPEGQ
jgi:uncharacterized protein YbjT (DUF2867 family)